MTKEEWIKIKAAKELLGLEDFATLKEIKKAYRRLSKKYHPDVALRDAAEQDIEMHTITEAYQLLLTYCKNYRFPLTPGGREEMSEDEWWLDRFGQDPLWGKG